MPDMAEEIPDPHPRQRNLLSLISTTSLWQGKNSMNIFFLSKPVTPGIYLTKGAICLMQVFTLQPVTLLVTATPIQRMINLTGNKNKPDNHALKCIFL